MCRIWGDLVTEMEFNFHYYVFMGVKSTMFHHYGFTVAQKGQTKQTLERMHHTLFRVMVRLIWSPVTITC